MYTHVFFFCCCWFHFKYFLKSAYDVAKWLSSKDSILNKWIIHPMHLLQARTTEAAEAVTKKKGKESDTADRIPEKGFPCNLAQQRVVGTTLLLSSCPVTWWPRWWCRAMAWVGSAFACARLKGVRKACVYTAPRGGLGDSDGTERAGWGSVSLRWKERNGGDYFSLKTHPVHS